MLLINKKTATGTFFPIAVAKCTVINYLPPLASMLSVA